MRPGSPHWGKKGVGGPRAWWRGLSRPRCLWTSARSPSGLGPAPWPRTPPSTEREASGTFCTMEKPEGREWPSLLGEGSGASPSSHPQRQGPSGLLVGVGCSVSHRLGTQEVKPKVGRGGVTALGPGSPCWLLGLQSPPCCLSRVQFYVPIGDIWPEETPLKPSLT